MMYYSPEYIEPLREEVESIVREQGWTKASILNMRKLDSFLREAQRLHNFSSGKDHPSKCLETPYTDASQLQWGVWLPGTSHSQTGRSFPRVLMLLLPLVLFIWIRIFMKIHWSSNPSDFQRHPKAQLMRSRTRWSRPAYKTFILGMASMHGEVPATPGGTPIQQRTNFFDSPGRFFAVNELKCMMGHILLNYDVKWPNRDFLEGGYAPPDEIYDLSSRPNENATVMFRRRIRV